MGTGTVQVQLVSPLGPNTIGKVFTYTLVDPLLLSSTAVGINLSNNALTATSDPNAGATINGVQSNIATIANKYYVEFALTFVEDPLATDLGVGIDIPSTSYFDFSFNEAPNGAVIYIGGEICIANQIIGNLVGPPNNLKTGSVIGMAVDLVRNLVWFAIVDGPMQNLNWNANGGDPANGTGGFSLPPGASTLFVTFGGGESSIITVNFGFDAINNPFALEPPKGFIEWPSPPLP
jgi:hypothetical protein